MRFQTIKLLVIAIAMTSCATHQVAFTSDFQHQYNFNQKQLQSVQFYTSADIVLIKTDIKDNAAIDNGKVVMINQQANEQIVIPKGTPCILVDMVDQNKCLFSFEYGDGRVLLFGNNGNGKYSLMAKNWKAQYGTIKYAKQQYLTNNGAVYLNIDAKKLKKLKSRQRVLGGRTIY